MRPERILVVGGSGFLGRHLCSLLAAQQRTLVVPTRRRDRARHLFVLPAMDVVEADVGDDAVLDALVSRVDAVVNLVGLLHDRRGDPYGPGFRAAHVDLPRRLAQACARGGKRLVHVSALGVVDTGPLPSMYLRSKRDGEQAIRDTAGLAWTIFRPSVVFGPEDRFLNLFAALQAFAPFMPLARAGTRFQPVFVGDVARAIVHALDSPEAAGRTWELAGPEVRTLGELVREAGRLAGHARPILALPDALGALQATLLEFAPGPTLMSRDNFDSMAADNVASADMAAVAVELGIAPLTPLAAAAEWLGAPRSRFDDARARARR